MPKSTMKFKSPVFTGEVYVMKEKMNKNVKVYHVTDGSDISSLKQIEKEEKKWIMQITEQEVEGNDVPHRDSDHVRPSAKFFGFEWNNFVSNSLLWPQVINFNEATKDNLLNNPFYMHDTKWESMLEKPKYDYRDALE